MNEFVQYVQSSFQYVYIPIQPTIGDKNIRSKEKSHKRSKELLYVDHYFLNGWGISVLVRLIFFWSMRIYYKQTFSFSVVFVCWCPFVTIFKCSNFQSHYTFFQVHQVTSDIVPILYNKPCIYTGDKYL